MPIRREHRFFHPIGWRELSLTIRFRRSGGWCERCRRPHRQTVYHLGDGRWWDWDVCAWRDGNGEIPRDQPTAKDLGPIATIRVVLARAHRDHDTSNNAASNLAALCQRCRMLHDRPKHRRRWRTLFRRKALSDLSQGLCRL